MIIIMLRVFFFNVLLILILDILNHCSSFTVELSISFNINMINDNFRCTLHGRERKTYHFMICITKSLTVEPVSFAKWLTLFMADLNLTSFSVI